MAGQQVATRRLGLSVVAAVVLVTGFLPAPALAATPAVIYDYDYSYAYFNAYTDNGVDDTGLAFGEGPVFVNSDSGTINSSWGSASGGFNANNVADLGDGDATNGYELTGASSSVSTSSSASLTDVENQQGTPGSYAGNEYELDFEVRRSVQYSVSATTNASNSDADDSCNYALVELTGPLGVVYRQRLLAPSGCWDGFPVNSGSASGELEPGWYELTVDAYGGRRRLGRLRQRILRCDRGAVVHADI